MCIAKITFLFFLFLFRSLAFSWNNSSAILRDRLSLYVYAAAAGAVAGAGKMINDSSRSTCNDIFEINLSYRGIIRSLRPVFTEPV